MGTLQLDLLLLEADIETQLSLAQMALDLQQDKHARKGVLSAAVVKAYAQLALNHAKFSDDKERRRFTEFLDMSVRLINAYWQDFGLVLLGREGGQTQVAAEVREKKQPKARHVVTWPARAPGWNRNKLDKKQRAEVIAALRSGPPQGYTDSTWQHAVAEQYHISYTAVRWYVKRYVNGSH